MSKNLYKVVLHDGGDTLELAGDNPVMFRGTRENDTHYSVLSRFPLSNLHALAVSVFFQGQWVKVTNVSLMTRNVKVRFVVSIDIENLPANIDITPTFIKQSLLDDLDMYDEIVACQVAVEPFP